MVYIYIGKDVYIMAEITTKQLFDMFFSEKDPEITRKTRAQIDRPEVYEYEKKIGKQLIDMNVDELFEMILSFNANRCLNNVNYSIGYSSFNQIASQYRTLFNFYIDNVKVIKNPFNDKRMKGTAATIRLAQNKEPFTKKMLDDIIVRIHEDNEEDRAEYIECILLLFYCGFSSASEIVALKESMIDFRNSTVRLPGRTIQLSERCFTLLQKINHLGYMSGKTSTYEMVSYHGSYFKFCVRTKGVNSFQDRSEAEISNLINREISKRIRVQYGIDISYRLLYLLGFVDFIKTQYGEKRCTELIVAVRDKEATKDLVNIARRYGIVVENVTVLKKQLRPFIKE